MDFDTVCIPQQIIFFIKHLDIGNSRNDKLKLIIITILNVILQQANLTIVEADDVEVMIDVSCDALKSMIEIVKYGDDANTILRVTVLLCSTCAGSSR